MIRLTAIKRSFMVLVCLLIAVMAGFGGCSGTTVTQTIKPPTFTDTLTTTATVQVTVETISDQAKAELIQKTIDYQTEGNVYRADSYIVVKLSKGDIIYGMLPGQSVFYTDQATLEAGQGSYTTMYRLLQIRPHPVYGYRTKVGKYLVLDDIFTATGTCLANKQITVDGETENLGEGGGYQYVVFDFEQNLKLVEEIVLHE